MDRQTHKVTALIAFGVIASAMVAEGARPPRLPRREATAPVAGSRRRRAGSGGGRRLAPSAFLLQ
ncbi:hypothetical protein [Sphingomonas sp. NIBR02145]|uniref:hypothetical protein n=1 Tax=Sphingomonas sp. NIBR02145 TaxID=3014784 RepID=UPI0022B55B32|nr:hypothetical protein [Sphingomonas sp. NIBR02145]WHU01839.1 hypothetical protein O3305_16805 [Sphingomonas sp. NIBR02145]